IRRCSRASATRRARSSGSPVRRTGSRPRWSRPPCASPVGCVIPRSTERPRDGAPPVAEFPLKKISPASIPHALDKAEGYRLRNDPAQAESIYRDVLAVDPENQDAVRGLILSLTDQFEAAAAARAAREAQAHVARLREEYERAYYSG